MRREANLGNTIIEILTKKKKKERGERNDRIEVREKKNFGDVFAEIKKKIIQEKNDEFR